MQFDRSALPSDGAAPPPVHTQGLADALHSLLANRLASAACVASAKALSTLVDAATPSKDMFVRSINWPATSEQ